MLKVGDKAPQFETQDATGNSVSLADTLRKGKVVLYFYPADFTPICTAQACAFQERAEALQAHAVQILGISPQNADSHRRFAERYGPLSRRSLLIRPLLLRHAGLPARLPEVSVGIPTRWT